jgi:hypothetical protein
MGELKTIIASEAPQAFEIKFKGETFAFKIKKLPWLRMTGILSKATSYSGKGTANVDMDVYYEEYLIAALVEAPWNLEETRFVLRKLDSDFGELLEEYVPKPGATEGEQIGFFGKKSETPSPEKPLT